MSKFDGILICTDLDGTLLSSDSTISKRNLDAIEYFKREGGLFTFITGRMPYFASNVYSVVKPNAPFGCMNGGCLWDLEKGEYIHKTGLPRDVLELVRYVDERVPGIGIQVNTHTRVYFASENSAMEGFRKASGTPNCPLHYDLVEETIAKIVFGDVRNDAIELVDKLLHEHPRAKEFDFIRSCDELYEILPLGTHKGAVLPHLSKCTGVSRDRIICVGDYLNDLGMIRDAGIGIAVGNAIDEVKAEADYVTVTNDEHALERIILDIEEGKLTF